MRVLLDTHVFLWALTDPDKLSSAARKTISTSDLFWSAASVWETLIKVQVGKLPLPLPVGDYLTSKMLANGVSVLPVSLQHVLRIEELEMHHRDPFDRILIAQSIEEKMPLVTADPTMESYPVEQIW
jgi:PIN domain nuclease of toxin-antitoxin system